ncbi:MAG: hypothetical protein AB7L94_06325 [Kofleriaceae bacterium]
MDVPTTTAAATGRDLESSEPAKPIATSTVDDASKPFAPTEQWLRKYRAQATTDLIASLNRYARTRAFAVGAAGRKVDDYYARELVVDALSDTWFGVVRWDPEKSSLRHHIVRTIDGRSDKHRKQAEKRPHDAIGDDTENARTAEAEASEQTDDETARVRRRDASEKMAAIRALAANDAPLLRILDAIAAGCETKKEVLAHARMRSSTYQNAYARLRRIIRHLNDYQLADKRRA